MRRVAAAGGRRRVSKPNSWIRRLGRFKNRFPQLLRTDFWRTSGRRRLWNSMFRARGKAQGETPDIPTVTVRRKPKRAAVRQTARQASPPRWLENLEPRRMLAASPVLYVDNNWTLVHDDGSHTLSVGDLVSDGVNTNLVYGTQAFGKVTSSTDPNVTISSPTSVAGAATIQDAINLAETSATGFSFINVYAGSYSGPLNISPSSTQNLTIINLDSSGNPALGVLGSVVINAGSASTGITIGSNATATISGIKLQGIGIAGTGINDKGVLDLLDSQVALSGGALIGINVDNSGGGSTGFLFAQSDQVSGAGLFGIEAGGGANAQATIDKSEITDSGTADVAVSAGNVTITNSILSSTAASARGLLVLSAGNASVYGSDLSNNPIPVTNTNTATTIDASGNWWGNTSETTVLGETQGSVDITPYLDSGTDTDGGAVGFLGDFSQLSVTALGPQVEATGRIQEAVTDLTAGGTIHVNAGTYAENVTIDKSLSLLGAQVGNSASTRFGNFASGKADPAVEAILTTPSVDNGSGPPFNDLIRVTADDVTIDGLVLDGNNAALVQTGATEVGGVDADARRGIDNIDTTGTPISISGLTVQNDILQNFDDRAISLFNNGDLPATNDAIAGNVISNFAGFGVLLLDDAYADITHNTILGPTFATGIQLQNFFGGVDSMTWSNNNITLGQDGTGIFVNLFYAPGATVSITGNTINAASGVTPGDSSGLTFGIGVDSVQAGASVTLTSNIIGNNGPTGGEFDRGVDFWDDPTSATISYTGGSISNARVGVELDNVDPFFGGANVDTTVSVSGVTISAVQYGVLVNGTPLADASLLVGPSGGGNPNVVAGSVSLDLAGSSITTSSPTGVDVLVEAQSTGTFTAGVDLTGGTSISGGATGVAVSGANATATVSGATIDDPTTGILVSGGSAIISNTNIYNNTTGVQFTAGGSGSLSTNNFNGDPNPDNGTDLLINSTAGLVALLGGNIFAGTTFIDDQASGELNATGETFVLTGSSTVLPADNTLADLYSVEDRIKDGIDQSGPGLVRLRSGKVFVSHGSEVGPQGSAGAIQRAINLATSGDTVNVQAGAFAGGINVNKALTLVGAGSGASDTVISLASGNVLAISASGPDAVHPVTIRGVQISGGTRGVELNGTLSHLLLDNVVVTGATNYGIEVDNAAVLSDLNLNDVSVSTNTTSGVGFNVSTTGAVSGLTITTSHFDNNAFGLETQNAVGSLNNQTRFTNINISGTSFSNNTFKGIYVETLDDAVLNGITITDSGTGATSPAGIDINLKYGTYSGGITIENSTLTDDGTGNSLASPSPGVGLTIKGRNDAPSYNSDPASLTNVTLQNDTITGSPIDLAIGNNVSGVSLSGVQLQGSGLGLDYYGTAPGTLNLGDTAFDGALVGYILNASANNIDTTGGATFNSFNTGAGPVAGNVPTYYAIEDKIADGIDAPGPGYVQLATGNEFVTPGSFENLGAAPFTTTSADVQRAVNAAGTGDTVYIEGGSYTGNVDTGSKNLRLELGASPASVSISGNLTLHSGDTVHLEVNAAGNDLLTVSGNVDLGGATLDTTGDTNPLQYPAGQSATILIKSSAGAITGTFAGMSDGDEINVDGEAFIIYYTGGSGNDVVLTSLGPAVIPPPPGGPFSPPGAPTVVFVDDDWASFADGS
ncbi:MAG TPA: hypothetical protein VFE46_10710, partial [Pirellulales bacterium]|nr:hypothetical protein [Pirellulales bacterium]